MIEVITESVEMPALDKRRFQKGHDGKNWTVEDTEVGREIYKGSFEQASLICHNLNKKHYRDNAGKP